MTKNTKIVLGAIAMTVIFGIIVLAKQDDAMITEDWAEQGTMEDKKTTPEEVVMDDKKTTMESENITPDTTPKPGETPMTKEVRDVEEVMVQGTYEAYMPQKLARAETGDVVLFFHASWCPSCRSLSSDIEKNMSSIPEGVSILKVDYDKETELKKQYGVTYQHTLVQVSADGTLIKKWSGSPKLSTLVKEIE